MNASSAREANFISANIYQNRSQTESSTNGSSIPSLDGTLSQSIPNFDICIVYNRENGYAAARETLESLKKLDVILYAEETEKFDPVTVEARIACSACLLLVLSMGTLKSSEVLFALSAADYYFKEESRVIVIHDAASCFIPGYEEQPAPYRKYFGDRVFPFFTAYIQQGCQEVLRRYEAYKKPSKSSTAFTFASSSAPSAVSLGIQEILDKKPTKQEAPSKRTTRISSRNGNSSTTSTSANLNNNTTINTNNNTTTNTNNNISAVSVDPPHYFFPSIGSHTPSTTPNNTNTTKPSSVSVLPSTSGTRAPRRTLGLKSLSRSSEDVTEQPVAVPGLRTSGSVTKATSANSTTTSSSTNATKPTSSSTRTTLTRSSERTFPSSTYQSSYRTPRRTPSGEIPSGNVGMYPSSNPANSASIGENLDIQSLEDAELQLALELSKHESSNSKPTSPPPNTADDERLARALQEEWNRAHEPSYSAPAVESPTREQLSDELYALLLQDSENAPIHLQPVYPDSDSEPEDLPSAYDLFDAPPIPLFPGHAYNPYFNHSHHHPTTHSNSHGGYRQYGNQIDVDSMSYEELLELEERMGKAKSEGATKEQISALPTRKVTKVVPDSKCSVCQCEFELGQVLTSLPCFHSYHSECIENWLTRKRTCPECMKEI